MAVSSVRRKLTYEDLVRMPEDNLRHEILDGVHHVTASPTPRHQRVLQRVNLRIGNYVEQQQRGEVFGSSVDTLLAMHDVVPDRQFISGASPIVRDKNIRGRRPRARILSPSTRRIDRGKKLERYERLGILGTGFDQAVTSPHLPAGVSRG
jgi:Uma2 family endonuclease